MSRWYGRLLRSLVFAALLLQTLPANAAVAAQDAELGRRFAAIMTGPYDASRTNELRAIPKHDAWLAEMVRSGDFPQKMVALIAMRSLGSPALRGLAQKVVAGPRTGAARELFRYALDLLGELDGPTPLDVLAPLLTSKDDEVVATAAALLGRGDANELRALAALYGRLPRHAGLSGLIADGELKPADFGDPTRDADGDGIPDATEHCLGLSMNNADSDGDGVPDGVDPSPTWRPHGRSPHVELLRAALAFVARFHDSRLSAIVRLDAAPDLADVLEGVAAVTLPAATMTTTSCGFFIPTVMVRARTPPGDFRRAESGVLRVEERAFDGRTGSVELPVWTNQESGYSIRLDLALRDGAWRVIRHAIGGQWIE